MVNILFAQGILNENNYFKNMDIADVFVYFYDTSYRKS